VVVGLNELTALKSVPASLPLTLHYLVRRLAARINRRPSHGAEREASNPSDVALPHQKFRINPGNPPRMLLKRSWSDGPASAARRR